MAEVVYKSTHRSMSKRSILRSCTSDVCGVTNEYFSEGTTDENGKERKVVMASDGQCYFEDNLLKWVLILICEKRLAMDDPEFLFPRRTKIKREDLIKLGIDTADNFAHVRSVWDKDPRNAEAVRRRNEETIENDRRIAAALQEGPDALARAQAMIDRDVVLSTQMRTLIEVQNQQISDGELIEVDTIVRWGFLMGSADKIMPFQHVNILDAYIGFRPGDPPATDDMILEFRTQHIPGPGRRCYIPSGWSDAIIRKGFRMGRITIPFLFDRNVDLDENAILVQEVILDRGITHYDPDNCDAPDPDAYEAPEPEEPEPEDPRPEVLRPPRNKPTGVVTRSNARPATRSKRTRLIPGLSGGKSKKNKRLSKYRNRNRTNRKNKRSRRR